MKRNFIQLLMLALVASTVLLPPKVFATGVSQASVIEIKGEAKFLKNGQTDWVPLEKDTLLTEGDKIKTANGSLVRLMLTGNAKTAELTVREDTEFTFKTFRHDETTDIDNTLLDVELGSVLVKAEKLIGDSKFEVKTPTSIVGIRGTVFEVNVSKA